MARAVNTKVGTFPQQHTKPRVKVGTVPQPNVNQQRAR